MNNRLVCLTCVFVVSLQKTAYMIASGVICLIYILCAIVLFFGVREQKGTSASIVGRNDIQAVFFSLCLFLHPLHSEYCRQGSERTSFFQGIKLVMGHGPYVKLVTGFLFTSLAFMVRIDIDLCTGYCLDSVRGICISWFLLRAC